MASTYSSLNIHAVFATKDRVPIIADAWRGDLHAYIGGIIRGLNAEPLIVGGVADHVHALFGIKATHCVADVVRDVKANSSSWASNHRPGFAWQVGYGAFSIAHWDVPKVMDYIARQEEHHRKVTAREEMLELFKEFGVVYDPKYFE